MRKPSHTSTKDEPVSEYGYTVIFNQLSGDDWQVIVPAFPEIVTHGRDLAEARRMARDAIRLVLEGARARGEQLPAESESITERVAVHLS
jgi:predicted RNase H-like HicB family nuclease